MLCEAQAGLALAQAAAYLGDLGIGGGLAFLHRGRRHGAGFFKFLRSLGLLCYATSLRFPTLFFLQSYHLLMLPLLFCRRLLRRFSLGSQSPSFQLLSAGKIIWLPIMYGGKSFR